MACAARVSPRPRCGAAASRPCATLVASNALTLAIAALLWGSPPPAPPAPPCTTAYTPDVYSNRHATTPALPLPPAVTNSTAACAFMRGAEAVVFLHAFEANAWRAVLDDTVTLVQHSPLRACGVRVLHSMPPERWPYAGVDGVFEPMTPSARGRDLAQTELHTLAALHDYCGTHPHALVAYVHGKGSRGAPTEDATRFLRQWDWRRLHLYFMLEAPQGCLAALAGGEYDACGVNKRARPRLHYSGNFWWARCDFIRRLPNPFDFAVGSSWDVHFAPENWIGGGIDARRMFNCFDSDHINHYKHEYSRSNYVGALCDADVQESWLQQLPI